jgi:hypothetical protein
MTGDDETVFYSCHV